MRAEIINTGSELLLGQVTNSHLGYLAQSLFGFGLRAARQTAVPDGPAIATAFREAMARADLIIVTGGLGPTSDDITRDAVAAALGKKLIFHQEILDGIAAKFAARRLAMNDLQRVQAMVPEGGIVLGNAHGTAPGLIIEGERVIAILLPGPPAELRDVWENGAAPWLRKRFAGYFGSAHEITLRILGLGETRVQILLEEEMKALGPIEVGYCARPGEVDLRLICSDPAPLQKAAGLARAKLGDAIYAEGRMTMEESVVLLARAAGKTVATAESCTGGLIANRITNVSYSSEMFRYGWVTYANEAKITELGVSPELLERHGAVSAEVARAMALGAQRGSDADFAVAVTGIAGPTGGTPEKPVGLVWFALARRDGSAEILQRNFPTARETFKYMASQVALNLLRRALA
ncbi:MAG TPA: competence/damage-inducible protein A [Candidatus Methylacidiphilales bacterium]|nr:competence/damage-inducible protein A [Candidatus Methylacidiphilales bacterium]